MIDNIGPHVERVFIAHSELPWNYNPRARKNFKNPTDISIIEDCAFRDKVQVIEGVWSRDEDQRNACVDEAVRQGFDFLIVQDADEFVQPHQYQRAFELIREHSQIDLFRFHWRMYWKSTDNVLVDKHGEEVNGTPEFALNLNRGVRFVNRRITNAHTEFLLPIVGHHLSFVGSDEFMYTKVKTWGHTQEFNSERWFHDKWMHWHPKTRYLHPLRPTKWYQAIPRTDELPPIIQNWPHNNDSVYDEQAWEKLIRIMRELVTPGVLWFGRIKRSLLRRLLPFR
mgnify:CR=1 FL=1